MEFLIADRVRLFQILDEFYKTRSQIVHEGRIDKEEPHNDLNNMISYNLTEISLQIFLRYICLLNMGLDGDLSEWILPDPERLSFKNSRPKAIAQILDALVLDPGLTGRLEKRMEEWGVYENFIKKMKVQLDLK